MLLIIVYLLMDYYSTSELFKSDGLGRTKRFCKCELIVSQIMPQTKSFYKQMHILQSGSCAPVLKADRQKTWH